MKKADYTKLTIKKLNQLAEQGDVEAQAELGFSYYTGDHGLEPNLALSLQWCKKAARQGHPEAAALIAEAYETGEGVQQDMKEAIKWYTVSAQGGNVEGQCALAYLLQEAEQYAEAWKWYEEAAKSHEPVAYYNLGIMTEHGEGVEKDYKKAFNFYKKAADKGYDEAQYCMGYFYDEGLATESDPEKATKYFALAADQGHEEALLEMGKRLKDGIGIEPDAARAAKYLLMLVEQSNNSEAMMLLGALHENPYGTAHDYETALHFYTKAWQEGEVNAAHEIGLCYFLGHGVEQNNGKSWEWLKKAAESATKLTD